MLGSIDQKMRRRFHIHNLNHTILLEDISLLGLPNGTMPGTFPDRWI